MTKGGQQIKGDFISMVLDDDSKWFIKFKDTIAANFPGAMYRSCGYLPTSKGKQSYSWTFNTIAFVERLQEFLN